MTQIRTFKDLRVWEKSHKLTLSVYKTTKHFPTDEKFGLTSQMRRASVSVSSNIVEGFRRKTTKDSDYFYTVADSSLEELKYQILLSKDLKIITTNNYNQLISLCEEVSKMLHKWKYCCKQKPTS